MPLDAIVSVEVSMKSDAMTKTICVFVCSSDNTRDVFEQVARAFEVHWRNCPFERYVGLNSPIHSESLPKGFKPLYAPVAGWRSELERQLAQLPVQYTHVLLFLDDFLLLKPVEWASLQRVLAEAIATKIEYLRLVPVCRALLPRLLRHWYRRLKPALIEPIPNTSPYYSSLQVALWKREHLREWLKNCDGTIWEFEHHQAEGSMHYAVVGQPPISYEHVVEKGIWRPHARRLFNEAGLSFNPGSRLGAGFLNNALLWYHKVKFLIIGYSWVRVRRAIQGSLIVRPRTQADGIGSTQDRVRHQG